MLKREERAQRKWNESCCWQYPLIWVANFREKGKRSCNLCLMVSSLLKTRGESLPREKQLKLSERRCLLNSWETVPEAGKPAIWPVSGSFLHPVRLFFCKWESGAVPSWFYLEIKDNMAFSIRVAWFYARILKDYAGKRIEYAKSSWSPMDRNASAHSMQILRSQANLRFVRAWVLFQRSPEYRK
jgi:hypothetical protein